MKFLIPAKYIFHTGFIKKLEQDETFSTSNVIGNEEDIVKKMIIVSLWCIQTNPSDQPPIEKVTEMLEGSTLLSLQFPPKASYRFFNNFIISVRLICWYLSMKKLNFNVSSHDLSDIFYN